MTLGDFASTFTREFTPGPGAYSTERHNSVGGKYSVRVAVRPKYKEKDALTSNIDFPPVNSSLNRRRATIAPKTVRREMCEDVPGPEYCPDPKEFLSRSCVIQKCYAPPDTSKTPGPGSYSPQEPGASSNTKPPPMGARPKIVLADVPDSPGPSAYDIKRDLSSTRCAIRPRTAMSGDRTLNPGFQHNNPDKLGDSTPRWTMPRANKPMEVPNGNPGPGAYDPNARRRTRISSSIRPIYKEKRPLTADVPLENTRRFPENKRTTIGEKSGRGFWDMDDEVPGPGYLPGTSLKMRQITIGEKRPDKGIQETPGPSDYNPRNPRLREPPVFSCKGPPERNDWLPKKNTDPGPGEYDIRKENELPRWIMGERSVTRSELGRTSTRDMLVDRPRTEIRSGRRQQKRTGA